MLEQSNTPPGEFLFFFFNDTATTEIYTLSLHDALPISTQARDLLAATRLMLDSPAASDARLKGRSEEHTSELQSQSNLVCRLLLEKKKNYSCRAANTHAHTRCHPHAPTDVTTA